MSAIQVEGLSKRYIIGHQGQADTLRDAITGGLRRLWKRSLQGRMRREEFWALREVSFSMQPGEVIGIIGRNGAGKSTLLKILSRITEPTKGRIQLNGRVASLLEVGTGFHPELSGRENIFLNGAILGMSRREILRKFDEIVAFAEVERFLDTPVKRYSSGMYVRLAFAVAAHLEPEILIVDEVLAVGDADFQRKCLGKMSEVAQGGRTVLFVSHNLAAVAALCPRSILLQAGRIRADGPTAKVMADYLHEGSATRGGWHAVPAELGARDLRICSLVLCDEEGNPADSVQNGRSCAIRIGFRRGPEFDDPVTPSISVATPDGLPLLHHHARLNKQAFADLPISGCFEFRLPRLALAAGNYRLAASLVVGNRVADQVNGRLEISVQDGPFYATGESTPASHGLFLVDGEWRYDPEAMT